MHRHGDQEGGGVAANSIPTEYGGIVFRSRTEARWAFFFDQLDIRWEYETQPFVPKGIAYLPDFLIFGALGTIWTEVKGAWENDPEGIQKFRTFASWRPQPSRAALIVGNPAPRAPVTVTGGDEDQPGGLWEDVHEWRPCPSGYHFDLCYAGTFRSKLIEDGCPHQANDGEERIERAVRKARNHRFWNPKPKTAA